MPTVNADQVRIPREAREAVARHERVVVLNRERPVLAIVHPDDASPRARSGRPLAEIVAALSSVPRPDPAFAEDMEAILEHVGPVPAGAWE